MSREPKRMDKNVLGSGKIIVYITVATVIGIVILSYSIIGNMLENRREEQRLAEIEKEEIQNEEQTIEFEVSEIEIEEEAESVSTQIGKTVEESSKENKIEVTTKPEKESSEIQKQVIETANENKEKEGNTNQNVSKEKEEKEVDFAMPVEGEIVKGFAKDSLVYSETLQEWVVHQAIDIKANSRDVVKAAAEGTIIAIKSDPRYGLTVIIEHERGFKTVYSNLLTAEFVVEGENVKQGQTLGTVGSSATFEIADEPHLHFEMLKDSEYIDPTLYIK